MDAAAEAAIAALDTTVLPASEPMVVAQDAAPPQDPPQKQAVASEAVALPLEPETAVPPAPMPPVPEVIIPLEAYYSSYEAQSLLLGTTVTLRTLPGATGLLTGVRGEDGFLCITFPWGQGFIHPSALPLPRRFPAGSRVMTPQGRGKIQSMELRESVGVVYTVTLLDIRLASFFTFATSILPAHLVKAMPEEIYPPGSRVILPWGYGSVVRSEFRPGGGGVGLMYEISLHGGPSKTLVYSPAEGVIVADGPAALSRLAPLTARTLWYHQQPLPFAAPMGSSPPCRLSSHSSPFPPSPSPPTSLLATLPAAILSHFTTREATTLRAVCREFRAAVAAHPWDDRVTRVEGTVAGWRACFPGARGVNLARRHRKRVLVDSDLVHLAGLESVDLGYSLGITSAGFKHLAGVRRLDMRWCSQAGLGDEAFQHLGGVQELVMTGCSQATITDAAFAHLGCIRSLSMAKCTQTTITAAAFTHLAGLASLDISECTQIPDAAFAPLKGGGLKTLNMSECSARLSDAALAHLSGIHTLLMAGCSQPTITEAGFAHLAGIQELDISRCKQLGGGVFKHLGGIKRLNMSSCTQFGRCPEMVHLKGVETLHMAFCSGPAIFFARELGFLGGNKREHWGLEK